MNGALVSRSSYCAMLHEIITLFTKSMKDCDQDCVMSSDPSGWKNLELSLDDNSSDGKDLSSQWNSLLISQIRSWLVCCQFALANKYLVRSKSQLGITVLLAFVC